MGQTNKVSYSFDKEAFADETYDPGSQDTGDATNVQASAFP